jgi:hypothetical protein
MSGQHEVSVGELKAWHYGSSVFLVSREGRAWRAHTGKGGALERGRELAPISLRDAQQDAKRDMELRRPTVLPDRVSEGGRRVVSHGSPLPLVFEEAGRSFVRVVQPRPHRRGPLYDPLPLRGDSLRGWVKLRDEREGLIVLHAPSLAAQLFGLHGDEA